MEASRELITVTSEMSLPAMNVETAVERFQQLGKFVSTIMKTDLDYGVIPGTPKPTLLKPGAEKLCTFFGLTKEVEVIEKEQDWTGEAHGGEPFFYYWYRMKLYRANHLIAEADGSANSWETKHRYRQGERKCPKCGKETIFKSKQDKGGWYCWSKKGGCGAQFPEDTQAIIGQDLGKVKNPNPADLVNTVQKMAYKRALVAATLVAVNASEYFTQDIEDLAPPEPPEPSQAAPQPPQEPKRGRPKSLPSPAQESPATGGTEGKDWKDRAVKAAEAVGYYKDDLEGWLEKKMEDWDEDDRARLREWLQKEKAKASPSSQ